MIGTRATIALALLALVVGLWAGYEWRHGRDGIAEAAQLKQQHDADRAYIDDLKSAADTLRQGAVDRQADYTAAIGRMDAIAAQLEQDHEANQAFAEQQHAKLDALLADRPDLRDLRLGDDVLQHWRDSNAGRSAAPAGAAGAAAPAAGQPARAVPAAPAAAKRPGIGAAGQPRRGGEALPRLSRPQRIAVAGDGRMACHGPGLVLQGGENRRAVRHRLPLIRRLTLGDGRAQA